MAKLSYRDLKNKLGDKQIFGKEDCPFCLSIKNNSGEILWKNNEWAVRLNNYPYTIEGKHIMLIPIRHYSFCYEINQKEGSSLHEAYKFINSYFGNENYFSFTRESFSQRSVEHFHTHFISGKIPRVDIVNLLEKQGYTHNL